MVVCNTLLLLMTLVVVLPTVLIAAVVVANELYVPASRAWALLMDACGLDRDQGGGRRVIVLRGKQLIEPVLSRVQLDLVVDQLRGSGRLRLPCLVVIGGGNWVCRYRRCLERIGD